jgi:hypothetical protein
MSMRKRKYGNKKKSKKCGCGVKLPFLKWGGDAQNGQTNNDKDFTSKLKGFYSQVTDKITSEYDNLKTSTTDSYNKLKTSTTSVINDTNKQISDNTKNMLNKTQSDAKNTTDKVGNFFSGMFANAKNTVEKFTNKKGSVPTKPIPPVSTSSGTSATATSTSSLSKSNGSTSSITNSNNPNTNKYNNNVIERYKNVVNNNNKQGGKRRSLKTSKKRGSRKNAKSKTKRMIMYKHKGGSHLSDYDAPFGIEKSSLAFTASPISNIKAVAPTADQMYGQTPYPAWRFSN